MLQMWADTVTRSEDELASPPSSPITSDAYTQRQRHSPVESPLENLPRELLLEAERGPLAQEDQVVSETMSARDEQMSLASPELITKQRDLPYLPVVAQGTIVKQQQQVQAVPGDHPHQQSLSDYRSQSHQYDNGVRNPPYFPETSPLGIKANEAVADASAELNREIERKNQDYITDLMNKEVMLQTEGAYRETDAANTSSHGMLQSMRSLKSSNHELSMQNVDLKHALDMQRYQNVADAMARERQYAQKEAQQALEQRQLKDRLRSMSQQLKDRLRTMSQELDQEHTETLKAKAREKKKVEWARQVSAEAAQEMKLARGAEQQAAAAVSDLRRAMVKVKEDILETADGTNESFGFTDVDGPSAAGQTISLDDA
jgi:hypothetical protein